MNLLEVQRLCKTYSRGEAAVNALGDGCQTFSVVLAVAGRCRE